MDKLKRLGQLFADEGYVGPLNFDFMKNQDGEYESIYDLNPRMTGVLPVFTSRLFLEEAGVAVDSVVNLSNGGKMSFSNAQEVLQELKRRHLLLTKTNQKGILLLPNMYMNDNKFNQEGKLNFDALLVNMELKEMQQAINILRQLAIETTLPEEIYW